MKKLTHIAAALANNTLSERSMKEIKGGVDATVLLSSTLAFITSITSATDDEKRRERPGGGISTN